MKVSSSWCSDEDMPLGEAMAMGWGMACGWLMQKQIPCGDDNKKGKKR
jgi:hypothetical protein